MGAMARMQASAAVKVVLSFIPTWLQTGLSAAGPCLALCVAGAAVALLAVLGPFDVLRSASSLHVCMALAGAMMTGGVLDLIFWVLDPFGWKNEG